MPPVRWLRKSLVDQFVGDDGEPGEHALTESCADRDIGGVASSGHKDPANSRLIVPRVKGVPARAEIDFKPGAEIHRRRVRRDADIAEVAGAISRRDVHAPTQGNGQMRKIPADTASFVISLPRCFGWSSVLVSENNMLMNKIYVRLHSRPTRRNGAE